MRVSTASFYEDAAINFNDMQAAIARSINKASTGIELTTPADNPSAAAQVLVTEQASALNKQYGINRQNAATALGSSDGVLSGVTKLMQSLSSQIVAAGNGTLNSSDRATMVQQFQSTLDQLMGKYLFSGSATGMAPYVATSNGAQYKGNQVPQFVQVDSSQQLAITVVGSSIFGNIQVSPHAYFGIANANNTSTATISSGAVVNSGAVTNDNYTIKFTSPTADDVTDSSTGQTVSTNNAYTSGAPIVIDGVQFNVTDGVAPNGVPAAGDQFSVQPGKQNIFQALTNIISALKQPLITAADQTNFSNSVAQANASINASLNNVLTVRGQLGNSLQQVTSLNSVGSTLDLSYQSTISSLRDANAAKVISQLAKEQITYQMAQKVFASTAQLSLLNMLP